MEFAGALRAELERVRPEVVTVELPESWQAGVVSALARLPKLSVLHHPESGDPEKRRYFLVEPTDPFVEALRWADEVGARGLCIDREVRNPVEDLRPWPDPYALNSIGHGRFLAACEQYPGHLEHADEEQREETMAWWLQRLLAETKGPVLHVSGIAHVARIRALAHGDPLAAPLRRRRRSDLTVSPLHSEASREVLSEPAYLAVAYEERRLSGGTVDRYTELERLYRRGAKVWEAAPGGTVGRARLRAALTYVRNLALVDSRLAPDLFDTLVAAKGVLDDDFAWNVWELATEYPWQADAEEAGSLRLTLEDLSRSTRQFRFQRRLRRREMRLLKRRRREAVPGMWKKAWKGSAICSFPPEDLRIESYGTFLAHRARSILGAESSRVEPFTTSILDGIDVRETIRNWHEGRIYVREKGRVRGKVGAVVVIFDADAEAGWEPPDAPVFPGDDLGSMEGGGEFPWLVTWHGEHENESDMAFYATPAGEELVGPGISRARYGGFMMTWPPGRLLDLWADPLYRGVKSKAELLILAALDYSTERLVVVVGEQPPRARFHSIAAALDRKIVYLPLGQLAPHALQALRSFHVLDGQWVRAYANDYIRMGD